MALTISDVGEFGLIGRISAFLEREGIRSERVTLGIGDDTASFLPRPEYEILVTCDALVEGRHFVSSRITPFDLGSRAMTVNISDIGAMGGKPAYALVSLGLNPGMAVSEVEELYAGFVAELNPFGAGVIGGNITSSEGMFIDVTLIGEVKQGKAVRRSGARPGDSILVTGYPGQSAAGLQLLLKGKDVPEVINHPLVRIYSRPSHRAQLGAAIADAGFASAMIDTSDGFIGDLGHICEGSRVGAELMKDNIPISDSLLQAARELGRDPTDFFFGDSDDYELIVTCAPEQVASIRSLAEQCNNIPITEVGQITASDGISLRLPGGEARQLKLSGWDHFRPKKE